ATRSQWVAQSLGSTPMDILEKQMEALENRAAAAEQSAIEARRQATKEFSAADFRFTMWKRLWVLLLATAVTTAVFAVFYAACKRRAAGTRFKPNWAVAMTLASCILAAVYGYQALGAVAGVGAAIFGLLLIFRS